MNVYPDLIGLTFPIPRKADFKNIREESESRRIVTATYQQYPVWHFVLSYDYLSENDKDQLVGFFLQQGGDLSPFLFDAGPGDNQVTGQSLGSGDGATKQFQLVRSIGPYSEPIYSTFNNPAAYVNGAAAAANFDSPSAGYVTFTSAPAAGAAITWTGGYYYRTIFEQSSLEFDEFVNLLYNANTVKLRTFR